MALRINIVYIPKQHKPFDLCNGDVMGEVRGAHNILVGRPEGRRPLGRPRRRWEDNIMMDLREIGFGDIDWIHWAQDRDRWRALVNTVNEPSGSIKCGEFLD
jgi:hypothetical protein